jgi:D-hydroxyproline dehydrogenase subunit gamma
MARTGRSALLWPRFAAALANETGIDVGHVQRGGLHLCLGEEDVESRARVRAAQSPRLPANPCRSRRELPADRAVLDRLVPARRHAGGVLTTPRFHRVAETDRRQIRITVDGQPRTALAGDTLMTAILTTGGRLRLSEFGDGPRAGFCVMGACQDCWVRLSDGHRLRACTTYVADGMAVLTGPEDVDG